MIKNLDHVQQDRLMAYLYKGMATLAQGGEVSGSVLLTWHEKVRFRCWGVLWLPFFKKIWVLFADLAIDYGFTAYRGCGRWVYCASYD